MKIATMFASAEAPRSPSVHLRHGTPGGARGPGLRACQGWLELLESVQLGEADPALAGNRVEEVDATVLLIDRGVAKLVHLPEGHAA